MDIHIYTVCYGYIRYGMRNIYTFFGNRCGRYGRGASYGCWERYGLRVDETVETGRRRGLKTTGYVSVGWN